MLIKEIQNRITELGGTSNFQGKSLHDDLLSIAFEKTFLFEDFADYIPDESYGKFEQELLANGFVSDDNVPCTHFEFEIYLYTPFKQGTDDYDSDYSDSEQEEYAKSIIRGDISDLMVIGYMDMERYLICLADENPDNPTVYRIDMDSPFSEWTGIVIEGTLEEFLKKLLSPDEYRVSIESMVDDLRSK